MIHNNLSLKHDFFILVLYHGKNSFIRLKAFLTFTDIIRILRNNLLSEYLIYIFFYVEEKYSVNIKLQYAFSFKNAHYIIFLLNE